MTIETEPPVFYAVVRYMENIGWVPVALTCGKDSAEKVFKSYGILARMVEVRAAAMHELEPPKIDDPFPQPEEPKPENQNEPSH